MVNSLRIRDPELLRSSSRLLGFTFYPFWDPGDSLLAGRRCGPRCLQDPIWLDKPDSFLGWHLMAVDYRGPVALELIAAAFCWGRVYGCRASDRDGPGRSVGSPLHWISAGIGLVTLAEQLVFQRNWDGKGYSRRNTRDIRAEFRCNQGSFAPTPEGGRRRVEDGLPLPKKPGYLILTPGWCCGATWAHDRLRNCAAESAA
ncbi:hypothetical protein BGY98DRAFT_305970 [Russula aff. rugulosa BPL654]|nr:hypothetical protein BGY98DRAFT_305970 [Russula aff. rugulosa BPL654]